MHFFVLIDGALLSVGPDGVSVVGQVDAGLVAISQSPDEELFIIVTEASSLILMTRDFDPLTEIPLDPADPLFRGEQVNILKKTIIYFHIDGRLSLFY